MKIYSIFSSDFYNLNTTKDQIQYHNRLDWAQYYLLGNTSVDILLVYEMCYRAIEKITVI